MGRVRAEMHHFASNFVGRNFKTLKSGVSCTDHLSMRSKERENVDFDEFEACTVHGMFHGS